MNAGGNCNLRNLACSTHTCKGRRAGPERDQCGRKHIARNYRCKEEGHPWLVGQRALSTRTVEEGTVLNPGTSS